MKILPLIVLLSCVTWELAALAQDDSEQRPAPSRGLLKRGLLAKGKQTTTTTTPAPQEEVEYEDESEYADGEVAEPSTEAPLSSTEGKKLVAGGVRPFRSNKDLLDALKRRRAQVAEAKLHGHANPTAAPVAESATEAPIKASYSKKRFNNVAKESNNEDVVVPAKPNRVRFGRPSVRSIQEAEPEEPSEPALPARTGRTFTRRGN